jgi:hypothetical protein
LCFQESLLKATKSSTKTFKEKVFIKEISYDARIFEAAFGLIKFIPRDQAC